MSKKLKSEIISDFLNLLKDCDREYTAATSLLKDSEDASQDLLHQIELKDTYAERCKTATKLATVRRDRRYYKDMKQEAELLHDFKDEYSKAINALQQVLGRMRKVEEYHEERNYKPRIIKGESTTHD